MNWQNTLKDLQIELFFFFKRLRFSKENYKLAKGTYLQIE